MAKRKRLTPLGPMGAPAPTSAPAGSEPQADSARSVAPIADMAGAASARAALDEVTETLSRARAEGRMVLHLPHDAIQVDYLVRDRIAVDDEEMTALVESLRARGQQAPIEVADLGDGRYGLISGWRRCRARCGGSSPRWRLRSPTYSDPLNTSATNSRRPTRF